MRSSLVVAVALALGPVAPAQQLFVANAGFEDPPIAAGTFSTTAAPPGWSTFGNLDFGNRTVGVLDPTTTTLYPGGAPEGENVGVVFLLDDFFNQSFFADDEAGLEQLLNDTLQTSTVYTLSLQVGNIADDPNPPHNAFAFQGFPGYRVELRAGGQVLAFDGDTLRPAEGSFSPTVIRAVIGAQHAAAGERLEIRLVNRNAAPGLEVNFDAIELHAEPIFTHVFFPRGPLGSRPHLTGHGSLLSGATNWADLSYAPARASGLLLFGRERLDAPWLGSVLVLRPEHGTRLRTDAAGSARVPFVLPTATPAGFELVMQAWIADAHAPHGIAASNGVIGRCP